VVTSQRAEGLRERKKAETRQRLSDTATRMFLDRGFDGVKVTEIAAACQVSEKTVYNYFPTKESLVLDRWKATAQDLRAALTSWLAGQPDFAAAGLRPRCSKNIGWKADDPGTAERPGTRLLDHLVVPNQLPSSRRRA
jgi:AcrR family transcriptional regulator